MFRDSSELALAEFSDRMLATDGCHDAKDSSSRMRRLEEEISRLTWAVVDGWASREDRDRLAKLVEIQYGSRR